MIINFKNYTIKIEAVEGLPTLINITPTLEAKDYKSLGEYLNTLLQDKNSDYYKFTDSIKIKPLKRDLCNSIITTYQKNIDAILSQYPAAEVTGWTTKVFQSERWLAASDSDKQALLSELPMLVAESNSQDFAVITDLATRIKRKSDAYQLFHGSQTGIRYDLTDRLELVTTSEELDAFKIYMESKGY